MAAAEETPQVFVSYASKDRSRVVALAGALEAAGVSIWRDQDQILGGENYGPKIVRGIGSAKAMLVCCSDAAMRSKNVKQEIQLAWHYNVPCLPVLLEKVSYHEQVAYWLIGWQYVELFNLPLDTAVAKIVSGLRAIGISGEAGLPPRDSRSELDLLWSGARLTDQIWPVPAEARTPLRSGLRDLGAPQEEARHAFPLGGRLRIVIESDRDTNLLLLNKGTTGKLYCLCPSAFAPQQRLQKGLNSLPQPQSPHTSFAVTGVTGREHLLAVLSDEPIGQQWNVAAGDRLPARTLTDGDVSELVQRLRAIPGDRWIALATYFEILQR
jgi:hypothetical protein